MALGRPKRQARFEDLGSYWRPAARIYRSWPITASTSSAWTIRDVYTLAVGRPQSGSVLATVMILRAHEVSRTRACDRLERDLAWQAAAG